MIDFVHLEKYRENNRIEAKKALGGLPESIWETYSSFANTLGGLILLGVEEYRDHSLHAIDLPDPEGMVQKFWTLVNNPGKASACILSRQDVFVQEIEGKRIVCIDVPRADRYDLPVFINGQIEESYRRSGEGDYRCSADEIRSMLRDAEHRTRDMRILSQASMDALSVSLLDAYRERLCYEKPEGRYGGMSDSELLLELHAAEIGSDDMLHPTSAGMLMFFPYESIRQYFPHYAICCSTMDQSFAGGLYAFYLRAEKRILSLPYSDSVKHVLLEAMLNSLVNADYEESGGLLFRMEEDRIEMSNPGSFRIGLEKALAGGISDPRNGAVFRMFNLIGAGSHSGSGIPGIFRAWRAEGYGDPEIVQSFAPARITLVLPLTERKNPAADLRKTRIVLRAQQAAVIRYLTDHIEASSSELSSALEISSSSMQQILHQLKRKKIIVTDDSADPVCRLMEKSGNGR